MYQFSEASVSLTSIASDVMIGPTYTSVNTLLNPDMNLMYQQISNGRNEQRSDVNMEGRALIYKL